MAPLTKRIIFFFSEIESFEASTPMYRGVGKIFVKSTKQEVVEAVGSNIEMYKQREKDLGEKMQYLQKKGNSLMSNLKEIHTATSS